MGRDLLEQLQATITFKDGKITLELNDQQYGEVLNSMLTAMEAKEENSKEINQVFPGVRTSNVPGRTKNTLPIKVKEG